VTESITRQEKLDHANRILLDKNLPPTARLIGWYITDHINRKRGYAWTPLEHIAADLGIHERTVRRLVKYLERHFVIDRSHRQYEYRIPTPGNLPGITPGILSTIPGNSCTDTGHNARPSFEHPIKHPLKKAEFDELGKAKGRQANPNGGFLTPPGSAAFNAWKAYCTDHPNVPKYRALKRELENREQSGKPFNFETEFPPEPR
jgi:hypothetical protein